MCRNYLIYLLLHATVLIPCSFGVDDLWYNYQFGSGYGNRKELIITEVDAVDSYKTKENILEWRTLSLRNQSYALGMTHDSVTLLVIVTSDDPKESFAVNETLTRMNGTVHDASIFEYWSEDGAKSEIVAVVAVSTPSNESIVDLVWFRLAAGNQLINVWKWSPQKKITHFTVFELHNRFNILVANERYRNYTTADWYEFHLGQHNDFWLKQSIDLEKPTNSTAINTFQDKTFLSIPQEDHLRVFELIDGKHFELYKILSVGTISFVTSFKVGFQSFIAIDGFTAGIFEFTKFGLIRRHVQQANLHNVDYWLSIPISTYRDEEVLIAERTLDHTTHKSHAIQVILHHGGNFVLHEEMTCNYYGEMSNGLNCLVEEDHNDRGIMGSAFFNVNGTIGVLVPRFKKPSGLFVIHTEMKELQSPLAEHLDSLEARKEKLEEKMKEFMQKEQMVPATKEDDVPMVGNPIPGESRKSEAILKQSEPMKELDIESLTRRVSNLQETINEMMIQSASLPVFSSDRGTYDTLVLNGPVEVISPSNIKEVLSGGFNGDITDKILNDIYNVQDERPLTGHKTFLNLRTSNLEFDAVNEHPAENLVFKMNPLIISGDVTLQDGLNIRGDVETSRINNLVVDKEFIFVPSDQKYNDTLEFDSVTAKNSINSKKVNKFPVQENFETAQLDENLPLEQANFLNAFLPGNLTVVQINGEDFNEFLSSLCLKNLWTYIPGKTVVKGDISITEEALIFFLNNLQYPQEYVLARSNSGVKITGKKTFTNSLKVDELVVLGSVNGINPNSVITLSTNQNITGKMTFADLEITKSFGLEGELIGTEPDTIIKKPSILNSNELISDVNIKDLQVYGNIIIGNSFNETDLRAVLSDVIYRNESRADITSLKTFPIGFSVQKDLRIASNAINNIPLSELIHKDTQQILHIKELNGDVTIENLHLVGTWDDVDIIKLDQESVKLSGEQYIPSEIIFEEILEVNEMDIKKSLNEVPLDDYLYGDQEMQLATMSIEELNVENLVVRDNLKADQSNFDISEYDSRRMSLTREQRVSGAFEVNTSRIPNLSVNHINDIPFEELFDVESYTNKIMDMLFAGNLTIKELVITDSLQIDQMNGKQMQDILRNCLTTNDAQRKIDLQFDNVRFASLIVEKFNNIEFEEFKRNLIFKDEKSLELFGPKVYFNGFEVKKYIQTSKLNQISVHNILRKDEHQKVLSPIVVIGDVTFHGDCHLVETLNRIPMEVVSNSFEVLDDDTYKIRGDVVFERGPIIRNLTTQTVNGIKFDEFLSDVVYLDSPQTQVLRNVTFVSGVHLKGNLHVAGDINGVDLNSLKDEIVLITQDGVVQTPIEFLDDLIVREVVDVDTDLYTSDINGVNPALWAENALFINRGKLEGELHFADVLIENELDARYLNDVDLQTLIPLKKDIYINQSMVFGELAAIQDIKVDGFVNGLKLGPEYSNTVLSGRNQQIHDNVIFQGNVLVRDNLDIYGHINEHDLSKLVTTDTDQILNASYRFIDKTTINNDLKIQGLVNNINLTRWMHNGVKKSSAAPQIVSNSWTIGSNLNFIENVTGNGLINGLDIRKLADDIEYRRQFKSTFENDVVNNYVNICEDINGVIETARKQIFSFKYLDYRRFIELESEIETVHQFEHDDKNYLLIKDKGCSSKLFEWLEETFLPVNEFETGEFSQIVTVHDGEDVYFVTRGDSKARSNCSIDGTNIWKFEEQKLILIQKLNNQVLLQESKLPGTFYAIETDNVMEYKLAPNSEVLSFAIQKWMIPTENAAFLPPGFKTGLTVRNGENLYKLQRQENLVEDYDLNSNVITIGNYTIVKNTYIPGNQEEMVILNVGYPRWKTMMAVAIHEETSVKGKLDFIKIYEDPMSGKLFHKVPTYKPSSMVSLEFGENGETLLVFLENKEVLQIYEYKGIEGFKFRSSANIPANKIVPLSLPRGNTRSMRSFIGLINKKHFSLLEAIMDGDQLDLDQVKCTL